MSYLPIWALVEELTFGQLTTFISQIKPKYSNAWAIACYNNPKYKATFYYFPNKRQADLQKSYLYGALYVFKHLLIYEDNFTQRNWN